MSQTGRAIVIGAGISGLSAAYDLTRAGLDCTVLEKEPRAGGVIETRTWGECLLETGPDSFISTKPEALALIKELGMSGEVIGSNDHQRVTYILKKGRLVPLPEGVMMIVPTRAMPMLKSPLLGWGTKIRMGLELLRKPGPVQDRSVAEFVVDHFGQETLDYLAEPLLSGVYGGDPRDLSVASVLPRFLQMEEKYGSLARGALQSRQKAPSSGGSVFQTLRGGLGTLVDKICAGLNIRQATVETIERRSDGRYRVRASGSWIDADSVVLSGPAWVGSALVSQVDAELAQLLGGIRYSSSLTLTMIFDAAKFDGKRAGFGFLIPKIERRRVAAGTFIDTKWPNRAPANQLILRLFFGGIADAAILSESDESILAIARDEMRRILGLTTAPVYHTIARWPRAMAQYPVGHIARVKAIRERVTQIPGLQLAGNAYEGIGIPDCVRTGRQAARQILARTAVPAL